MKARQRAELSGQKCVDTAAICQAKKKGSKKAAHVNSCLPPTNPPNIDMSQEMV